MSDGQGHRGDGSGGPTHYPTVCAYCFAERSEAGWRPVAGPPRTPVSHGICPKCLHSEVESELLKLEERQPNCLAPYVIS